MFLKTHWIENTTQQLTDHADKHTFACGNITKSLRFNLVIRIVIVNWYMQCPFKRVFSETLPTLAEDNQDQKPDMQRYMNGGNWPKVDVRDYQKLISESFYSAPCNFSPVVLPHEGGNIPKLKPPSSQFKRVFQSTDLSRFGSCFQTVPPNGDRFWKPAEWNFNADSPVGPSHLCNEECLL